MYIHVLPLGESFTNYVALMWVEDSQLCCKVIVNMEMNNQSWDVSLCH